MHADPLDQLAALGIRIGWITDLGKQIAYDPEVGIVNADPDLCRREIARQALDLRREYLGSAWPDELPDAS